MARAVVRDVDGETFKVSDPDRPRGSVAVLPHE
jgi:hypothetical protein